MLKIAKCKNCGIYYPVKENETGKKCTECGNEAEEYMEYPEYKKRLNRIIITRAIFCGLGTTAFGFFLGNFNLHWALSIYAFCGFFGGILFALNLERASLAEIAAAVREEMSEDEE